MTTKAERVKKVDEEVNKIMDDLLNSMLSSNGLGLAAPQIGISKRIIAAKIDGDQLVVLANPEIELDKSTMGVHEAEGCLSLPGVQIKLRRAGVVRLKGLDRSGQEVIYNLNGLDAIVAQHEIDHLDGITMLQRADFTQKTKLKKQMKDWSRHVKRKEKASVHKPQKSSRTGRSSRKRS